MNTRVETLKLDEVELLELNARFMRHDTFQQLVKNVKRDGGLTSTPFAWKNPEGKWVVLSGNHRVKAARAAGFTEAAFIVTEDELTEAQRVAIQLSHNSLTGEDDPATLKQLYESIQEIDLKQYAGLDDRTLELLEKIGTETAPGSMLEWTNLTFSFLPDEADAVKKVFELAAEVSKGEMFAARMKDYEGFKEAVGMAGAAHGCTSIATELGLVLAVFNRHLLDLQEGWVDEAQEKEKHKGWVPIASVFGSTAIPADVAMVLRRALKKATESGDATPTAKWKLMEILAAEYLAGAAE
jgi:hypothetical protein